MNPFADKYKSYSLSQLLKITNNPCDYQQLAVEAAKDELIIRHPSTTDMVLANAGNEAESQRQKANEEKRKAARNKIREIAGSVVGAINPVQQTPANANKIIAVLSLTFAGLFVFNILSQFDFLEFMLTNTHAHHDFSWLWYFVNTLVFPLSVWPFWRRKKYGWTLFCLYLSYSGTVAVVLFLVLFKQNEPLGTLNYLSPGTLPGALFSILFFGACLWGICKSSIREIYGVGNFLMFKAAGIGGLAGVIVCLVS